MISHNSRINWRWGLQIPGNLVQDYKSGLTGRSHRLLLRIVFFIFTMMCSCSKSQRIYIDINKQAIISCDGQGLKEIEIEGDSIDVTLEGTQSVVYFNKKNDVSRTTLYYNDVVYDYILKLRPNRNYRLTKYNGPDRGSFRITFETDSSGRVTKASDESCN